MRMYVKVMAAVIACILMSGETHSTSATIPATENQSWFKKRKKKPEQEEKTKSDYEKLVEGSKITKGMFAVHQKKNDYYFEIPTSLLGRDLLIVNKLQRVPAELNDAGVNRGVNYENQMVSMEWDKATGKLMFRQQRPLPLAPQTDAIFRSVKDNFISPLIAAFKIEAINQDSTALVIKVNDIYDGTETSINNVFTNINLGTSAIKNLSRILSIKSFPNNVVATSELTTKVTEGTTSVYVTVEVSSSILLLPEKPMTGRFDNQKVGYFTNPLLSFSDAQQGTDKKQYITRWRMEPKPEDREAYLKGQTVEPIKPIVFYIDNSTPYQWRSYIKKGIEDWQTAFEKAGFNNGLRQRNVFTHAFAPGLSPVQINQLINGAVQLRIGIIKVNKCGSLFFCCFGFAKNTYFFIILRQPRHVYFGCRFSGLTGFNRIFSSCFGFCNASCRNGFIICLGRLAIF